jgi:hypothetical protein
MREDLQDFRIDDIGAMAPGPLAWAGHEVKPMKISNLGLVAVFLIPPLSSRAQGPRPASTWTIPGVANVPGQNGTRFVSDVAVTNAGGAPATVTVTFLPSGTYPAVPTLLAPGQTVVWRNVLQQLWGASASGALQVSSIGSPLLIRARTYNDAASGTYGVALPVYASDRFLAEGETGQSLWVSQSADAPKGYRTNIAVLFPDPDGGLATVTVYDGNDDQIGQTTFALDGAGVQQISVSKFSAAADVARATLQAMRGRAAGYAAVVDNVTGDSSLFTFDDLPAGPQDVVINGVARANGKNGTFFRTDGRFFNPGDTDVTVTAAFHENGQSNPTPPSGTVVVPAGKIVDVTDVLGTVLSRPVGSSGAVRFRASAPVGILCRTSNVDPTGANPGTFGAQQKPVPLLAFLSSADAGAVITGVRQNAAYRTNVALAAGADGVTAQYTLKTAQGAIAGTATQSLGAFGWVQTAVDKLFPGTAIPDDAQVMVKVTQGSGDVFDSSVDNSSGDSVVTPAPPLPMTIPSSTAIGPEGGSVRSDDGRLTLKLPAGALASPTQISIATTGNGAPHGRGAGYSISPGSLPFSRPAELVLSYGATDIGGSGPDSLGLAYLSGSVWYVLRGGVADTSGRTLIVPVPGLSSVSAGIRRGTEAAGPLTLGPFVGLEISPHSRAFLPGEKGGFVVTRVGVSSVGPGDPAALSPPASLDSLGYGWYPTRDGTIQRNEEARNEATYTAPSCVPSVNPVSIKVQVRDGNDDRELEAAAKIFPVHWVLKIDQKTDVNLFVGLGSFTYSFGTQGGETAFSLAPGGTVVDVHEQVAPHATFTQLTLTPNPGCTVSLDPSFALLAVDQVQGNFGYDPAGVDLFLFVSGSYTATATPGINATGPPPCPGLARGTEAGQSLTFGPVRLGPNGGKCWNDCGEFKFSILPVENSCGN